MGTREWPGKPEEMLWGGGGGVTCVKMFFDPISISIV